MKEWYNITELAEKTNIPDTTVRRYIAKFPDFFMSKGGTRSKRYEDTSVKILIRIKNLFDNGYETEEVDLTLRKEFPMVVDGDKVEKKSETPMIPTVEDMADIKQSQKEQNEMIKLLLEKVGQQESFNKALLERLDQQQKYIDDSLNRRDQRLVESLKGALEQKQIEAAATKETEEKKSNWFLKIFSK